jgi:hypothetical protein
MVRGGAQQNRALRYDGGSKVVLSARPSVEHPDALEANGATVESAKNYAGGRARRGVGPQIGPDPAPAPARPEFVREV